MSVVEKFVEEVSDSEQHHAGTHVHGPNCSHGDHEDDHEDVQNIHGRMVLNRNEKKARNELLKLGLKPITGIHRVTFVRGKTIFAISEPEVYKNPTSDSYIVFGEARVEDPGFQAQMAAAQRMIREAASNPSASASTGAPQFKPSVPEFAQSTTQPENSQVNNEQADEDEEEVDVDPSQLNESDIKIVMEQASVSRNKAIKSLVEHDFDVVNTIMDLSM